MQSIGKEVTEVGNHYDNMQKGSYVQQTASFRGENRLCIGENSFCMSMRRRKQLLYFDNQHAWPDKTTPLHNVWSMALSAMTVECVSDLFIYLQV